jgi:nicotinamidase-related amidase
VKSGEEWKVSTHSENWKPKETAIIICDMWNTHSCEGAASRVAELAPSMNRVLSIARNKGVKIVHAPSEVTDYYADYPQRKAMINFRDDYLAILADGQPLPSEKKVPWPVDQTDGGCDTSKNPENRKSRQIDLLTIAPQDLISADGAEIGAYFKQKGIKNVILMGVHTNMCIVNRSFALRAMKRMGINVVLMRDMTDLMYDPAKSPYVDHFTGLDLMVEYIEKYIAPTVLSTDFTGEKPFRFEGDKRSVK